MILFNPDNYGSRPVAVGESVTVETADVAAAIATMAGAVPQRSLVFALCSNTAGSLCGYISFIENGIVPVMFDARMHRQFVEDLTGVYSPDYIWAPRDMEGDFEGWSNVLSIYDYIVLKNPKPSPRTMNPDLALLLTTSGSTGSPKLVRISYRNLQSNARSIAQYLEIDGGEKPITSLPMHYSYGLSVINSHIVSGATILLTTRSIMEKEFWEFFRTEGATSISGVPYTYQMLKRLRIERMDLPSLRTMTQAGGKLSPDLVAGFAIFAKDSGRRFFVMYGQTEATARMSYLPWDKTLEKSASIGIAIPGGEFFITDTSGNRITEPGKAGELVYKGPNVSMGYADCAGDLTEGDLNGGELHTGDVAEFDSEGFFYIVGRLKRFVKVFGNRINLDQVEEMVRAISPDCAAAGEDDKIRIYLTDPSKKDEVGSAIAGKLGLHFSAVEVKIIDEIPKNNSGKTQYSQLQ